MNLVVNARDAMPDGGTLTLETADGRARPRTTAADTRTSSPGDYVLLARAPTRAAAWTRRRRRASSSRSSRRRTPDKGTGLGLATVYGIVKQSGGHIEVDSEPGRGTTFRLYFPQAAASETEALSPAPADERSLFGSETVLLVEDEQALREVGKLMLESYGYNVCSQVTASRRSSSPRRTPARSSS